VRGELAGLSQYSSRWGIPLIGVGLLMHLFSSAMRVYFSSGFSLLIVLAGLILYFYGWPVVRKLAFPLFFLIFMIPVPLVFITNVSFRMKVFAAQIATELLNNMEIQAIREGSIIKMKQAYVVVDDVCSGLRSLISLMALGSIFAYWMKSVMFKRIGLFLLTIPIAIITNVARIIFLAAIADIWGPQYATGFTHDLSGFIVFGLAFVLLFTAGKLLE
jgi:exosortase